MTGRLPAATPGTRPEATAAPTMFVMVKPDAVVQNLEAGIVARFASRGLVVAWSRAHRVSPADRRTIYGAESGGRLNWEVGAGLYSLGPALLLGLALADPTPERCDPHAAAVGLKGDFRPIAADVESIRGSMPCLNPVFNLVHCSDDLEEARRCELAFAPPAGTDRGAMMPVPRAPRPFDPLRLLVGLKAALLPAGLIATVVGLYAQVPDLAAQPRRPGLAALRHALDGELDLLRADAGLLRLPIADAALALADRRAFHDLDRLQDALDLAAERRPISSWERYLLMTTLFYLDFE